MSYKTFILVILVLLCYKMPLGFGSVLVFLALGAIEGMVF